MKKWSRSSLLVFALVSSSSVVRGALAAEPAGKDPTQQLVTSAYVQGQYETHGESEDQVRQGGSPLNLDRFVVRRARLKLEREWSFSSLMLEIDGNTVNGPSLTPHHAEASILYRGKNPWSAPPLVRLTFGMFDTPFGFELVESPRTRFFTERSFASRSLFPSEPDIGARLSGGLGWLRYAFAFVNGQPKDTPFALQDPKSSKDFVARVGGFVTPADALELQFGVSFLSGKGFHKGSDATKDSVVWTDRNENGQIDIGELQAVNGLAATPSQTFKRWALGADLRVRLQTKLGVTQLSGEISFAANLDRSALFLADPVISGIDSREKGYFVAIQQEIGSFAAAGVRFDFYDPNADKFDQQLGKLVPSSQRVQTITPMIAVLPDPHVRFVVQWDHVRDYLGRSVKGVPVDLSNDVITLRLQAEL